QVALAPLDRADGLLPARADAGLRSDLQLRVAGESALPAALQQLLGLHLPGLRQRGSGAARTSTTGTGTTDTCTAGTRGSHGVPEGHLRGVQRDTGGGEGHQAQRDAPAPRKIRSMAQCL